MGKEWSNYCIGVPFFVKMTPSGGFCEPGAKGEKRSFGYLAISRKKKNELE